MSASTGDYTHYISEMTSRCPVCGTIHANGEFAHDWEGKLGARTDSGDFRMCPPHSDNIDQGYVAIIEVDRSRSGNPDNGGKITCENAYRTGNYAFFRREQLHMVFPAELVGRLEPDDSIIYVNPGFIEGVLRHLRGDDDDDDEESEG